MNTYLIKVGNKIVSASSLTVNRTKGTISNVMTHPEFRRQGFARKLFNHAVEQAQRYNLEHVYLKVNSNNVKAINLYESENFKRNYELSSLEIENPIIVLPKHDSTNSKNVIDNSVFMYRRLQ
ncbi:MAG: GNAT family N-acetyltransferase, partial [Candidatus Heimdallarchaeota archaeon]